MGTHQTKKAPDGCNNSDTGSIIRASSPMIDGTRSACGTGTFAQILKRIWRRVPRHPNNSPNQKGTRSFTQYSLF